MTDFELYEEELRLKKRLDDMREQRPPPSREEALAAAVAYTRAYYHASHGVEDVETYRDE